MKDIGFSKYGKQFQESLVQLILQDRPFADQIEEVLDTRFFELKLPPCICFFNF